MRKAKETKSVEDLSKPINIDNFQLSSDDCFGTHWNPIHKECTTCADLEICGTIYQHRIIPDKVEKVRTSQGINFLDDVNFNRIPKQNLVDEITENPGKVTAEKLIKFVKHYSKCDDDDTLLEWIKQFKQDFNIKIKKGLLYVE